MLIKLHKVFYFYINYIIFDFVWKENYFKQWIKASTILLNIYAALFKHQLEFIKILFLPKLIQKNEIFKKLFILEKFILNNVIWISSTSNFKRL